MGGWSSPWCSPLSPAFLASGDWSSSGGVGAAEGVGVTVGLGLGAGEIVGEGEGRGWRSGAGGLWNAAKAAMLAAGSKSVRIRTSSFHSVRRRCSVPNGTMASPSRLAAGMTSKYATSLLPRAEERRGRPLADRLHVIAFGAIGWPWLLQSLSGGERREKRRLLARLGLPGNALPHLGSWKADTSLLHRIVDTIKALRPRTMVELGAGASTLVAAKALALNGGGRLVSFDQHADFVAATAAWLAEHGLAADLRSAELVPAPTGWPGLWYDLSHLPEHIDLLLVDGPPWSVHPFVRAAAETLFDRIPVGGVVLLDDAMRPGERVVARRWRRRWPNFRFDIDKSGAKGTLIGSRLR
ncbi:MAG TPA: class I SAM-dependent methyltransferase [Sphingomonas sp.]|nr:class I SAM-dependent methyltransferase [Sphingomonas sp.]